jgi:hypothetical protein
MTRLDVTEIRRLVDAEFDGQARSRTTSHTLCELLYACCDRIDELEKTLQVRPGEVGDSDVLIRIRRAVTDRKTKNRRCDVVVMSDITKQALEMALGKPMAKVYGLDVYVSNDIDAEFVVAGKEGP